MTFSPGGLGGPAYHSLALTQFSAHNLMSGNGAVDYANDEFHINTSISRLFSRQRLPVAANRAVVIP
jgi:hypothetical protein